jgi:cell division protein FtsN
MLRSSLALAALALVVSTAEADVYKTVDAQGQPHYSDQWSPGAVLIKSNSGRVEPSTPTYAPKASSAPDPNKEATKQVQSDMQAVHAQQCRDLKAQYDKEIHARRIYQAPDDSGGGSTAASAPKQYMTDAEADAERIKTRQAMDAACADVGDSGN